MNSSRSIQKYRQYQRPIPRFFHRWSYCGSAAKPNRFVEWRNNMRAEDNVIGKVRNRRSFLTTGLALGGAATMGSRLLARSLGQGTPASGGLTEGDAAILRFLAAGEALEADFYTQ